MCRILGEENTISSGVDPQLSINIEEETRRPHPDSWNISFRVLHDGVSLNGI